VCEVGLYILVSVSILVCMCVGLYCTYVCRTEESQSFVVMVPPQRQWFCPVGYVDGGTFGSICELCLACDQGVSSLFTAVRRLGVFMWLGSGRAVFSGWCQRSY
jgi:hypothetical protein